MATWGATQVSFCWAEGHLSAGALHNTSWSSRAEVVWQGTTAWHAVPSPGEAAGKGKWRRGGHQQPASLTLIRAEASGRVQSIHLPAGASKRRTRGSRRRGASLNTSKHRWTAPRLVRQAEDAQAESSIKMLPAGPGAVATGRRKAERDGEGREEGPVPKPPGISAAPSSLGSSHQPPGSTGH